MSILVNLPNYMRKVPEIDYLLSILLISSKRANSLFLGFFEQCIELSRCHLAKRGKPRPALLELTGPMRGIPFKIIP